MARHFKLSIVRVLDRNGGPVGAGFLAGEREIATCAHVVAAALDCDPAARSAPDGLVSVDFPLVGDNVPRQARLRAWLGQGERGDGDIAVLQLIEDPPVQAVAARLVSSDELWGHEFRTFGFPSNLNDGEWASGRLLEVQGTQWLQVEDVKGTGARVRRGYSGAPVFDERLNGVVGMVVAEGTAPGDKLAYVIPVEAVAKVDDDLQERVVDLSLHQASARSDFASSYIMGALQTQLTRTAEAVGPPLGVHPVPAAPNLIGRSLLLAELERRCLAPATSHASTLLLSGPPGVGKSALALALATRLREGLPDGEAYVDMQPATGSARSTYDVLGRVLRSLGVEEVSIPRRLGDRAALVQDVVRQRRALVVLDNVPDGSDVLGVMSVAGTAVCIATARDVPRDIEVDVVPVPPLDRAASSQLLARAMGQGRAASDRRGVDQLAAFTGGLPLALHIIAQRFRGDAHLQASEYAQELLDKTIPLERRIGHLDVIWRTLMGEYSGLSPSAGHLLQHVSLVAGATFDDDAAAALSDMDYSAVAAALEELVESHLLERVGKGRYRFQHNLVQLFAHERLAAEHGAEGERAAKARFADLMSTWARLTADLFHAPDESRLIPQTHRQLLIDRLTELDELEADLVAAAEHFERAGDAERLIRLGGAISAFARARPASTDLDRPLELSLRAAKRSQNHVLEATQVALSLGARALLRGDAEGAVAHIEASLKAGRSGLVDEGAIAEALVDLGAARMRLGALQPAIQTLEEALLHARRSRRPRAEAIAHLHLCLAFAKRREWSTAVEHGGEALGTARRVGDPSVELTALTALAASAATSARSPLQAVSTSQEALELARDLGDRASEILALAYHGLALAGQGRWRLGTNEGREAVTLARATGSPAVLVTALTVQGQISMRKSKQLPFFAAAALGMFLPRTLSSAAAQAVRIGKAHGVFGSGEGLKALQEAAALAHALGNLGDEAELHLQIAVFNYKYHGQTPETLVALNTALESARRVQDPYAECQALLYLGGFEARRGFIQRAIPLYEQALLVARQTGSRKLEVSARRRLQWCEWLYETPKDVVVKAALEQRDRWRRTGHEDANESLDVPRTEDRETFAQRSSAIAQREVGGRAVEALNRMPFRRNRSSATGQEGTSKR